MSLRIEEYIYKGEEFVQHVAGQLKRSEDMDYASRVIVSLLHTLRDVLTPEESLHLISQLPIYVKAVYVDGWRTSINEERINAVDTFIERLKEQGQGISQTDLNNETARQNIEAIFNVLKKYVSMSEIKKIGAHLPPELGELWNRSSSKS